MKIDPQLEESTETCRDGKPINPLGSTFFTVNPLGSRVTRVTKLKFLIVNY